MRLFRRRCAAHSTHAWTRSSSARPPMEHDMSDSQAPATLYLNRELSWLAFNARVLHEATDPRVPLLERLKFLAIFSSNLDEFFMVRVAGLRRQLESGTLHTTPDGLTAPEQLA